jgi:dimethyl sulfoxide reductase iron-sulfur subunit
VEERVSRRRFLGYTGAVATAAAAAVATSVESPAQASESNGRPLRLRRWAMVIDLRKCDGCAGIGLPPQCTQNCILSRYVPDGQQWIEVFQTSGSDLPGAGDRFFPAPCMQCQNAPCTNVCPVGATFQTPEGVVLIDQERCIGCRLCMAACPYDRRFFNWGEPLQPDYVAEQPYSVESQVPAIKGTVMKCDLCTEMASAGGIPACVDGCPQGAMYYGDLEEDVATNGTDFVQFSKFIQDNHAAPYKEELGTEPRVYYIPGSGELASESTVDPQDRQFLKDNLEWPWARIVAAAREQVVGAAANTGGMNG